MNCPEKCNKCGVNRQCLECGSGFHLDVESNSCLDCFENCNLCFPESVCSNCQSKYSDPFQQKYCYITLFSTQSEQVKDIMPGINESLVQATHQQMQQQEQEQISEEKILEAHFDVIDNCLVSNSTIKMCDYCRPGFFKNGNGCENCVVGCMKCQNGEQCDKCFEGFKLNDGKCYSKQVGCIITGHRICHNSINRRCESQGFTQNW